MSSVQRHDFQPNGTQRNNIQQNGAQRNNLQQNDTPHNNIQQNNTQYSIWQNRVWWFIYAASRRYSAECFSAECHSDECAGTKFTAVHIKNHGTLTEVQLTSWLR
jgi:hypothetical protein